MKNAISRRRLTQLAASLPVSYSMLAGMNAMGALSVSAQGNTVDSVALGVGSDPLTLIGNHIVDGPTGVITYHLHDAAIIRNKDDEFRYQPWLCELTNIDDLTWHLTLVQEGVTFSSGNPLTIQDFMTAFEFAANPDNNSHYLERWKPFTGLAVIDDKTIEITTENPFPLAHDRIAEVYPMDTAKIEEVGLEEYMKNPSGTGPYTVKEWVRNEYITLSAREDYWAGDVLIKEVQFRTMPEFATRLAALLAGELAIVKDVPVDSFQTVEDSGLASIKSIPSSRVNYVALVTNREDSVFFDNQVLRQAINHAVDVDGIIAGIFQDHATRMAGCLSELNPERLTSLVPYEYNPDRARELLAEAGYADGLEITMDAPQGRYPMDADAAMAIAASLGEVGITVNVQYNEWGTHLDKIVNRQTGDMFYLGWGPALDAFGTIAYLFVGDSTYSGFGDAALEEKISAASATVNADERRAQWDVIQQEIYDQAGWLFLWQQHDSYGISNDIVWEPRADERLWMFEASGA
ncbi:MAG: ABC transporter substrate-binding protein [Thermomicrobiales bacterium]|nr:ABC transporter substrate-binding protein [Thermomicrobiales bacterium]